MSDSFQQALSDTLPILKRIRGGFGSSPTASSQALETLQTLATRRSVAVSKKIEEKTPPSLVREESATHRQSRVERDSLPGGAAQGAGEARQSDATGSETLAALREAALACTKCPHLVRSRTQVVFGVGNPSAELLFVGEAPGADEDEQGEPFVGKAGQLLTKIIQAMGFSRNDVYIANVLKCRPDMPAGAPGNRKPKPEEMQTCLPWLEKQISLIQPRVMVALGATAIEGLLGNTEPVGRLRGRWLDFRGIPVMTTYHPAYLLRNQSIAEKRKVWEDMLLVLEKLEKPITEKQRQFFTKSG